MLACFCFWMLSAICLGLNRITRSLLTTVTDPPRIFPSLTSDATSRRLRSSLSAIRMNVSAIPAPLESDNVIDRYNVCTNFHCGCSIGQPLPIKLITTHFALSSLICQPALIMISYIRVLNSTPCHRRNLSRRFFRGICILLDTISVYHLLSFRHMCQ